MEKVREITQGVSEETAKGTPSGNAGDTHGQYRNELAWYREQDLSRRTDLAKSIGRGLERAVVIESYDYVRATVSQVREDSGEGITLSSVVEIQYGEDPDDMEQITLVSPLDGGSRRGYVSVETPLAMVIEGKKRVDSAEFKVDDRIVKVKIL